MIASLCFALWCAFGSSGLNAVYPPPVSLTLAKDSYSVDTFTERMVLVEQYRAVVGLVEQRYTLTPVVGYLPLHLRAWRVSFDGGAIVATGPLPERGTKANWLAKLRLHIAGPLSLEWWHISNARSAIPNPSIDAIGVTFSW